VCVFHQAHSTPKWGWTDRGKDILQKGLTDCNTVVWGTWKTNKMRIVRMAEKGSKTVLHRCFTESIFIRITSVFSYLYCKKTNTLNLYSLRGGTKTLKHNVRTTLQLSDHGCKYLTHTSKTPHVKCTQMVVPVRFMIRVTSLPRWNRQGIKICDWFLAYYTCGVKLLECRYAQVWNIAKRRKQSPIGWFL